MPLYEYRCRTCDDRFEVRRPMNASDAPADCPTGHADTVRLLSMFASVGAAAPVAGGGCCGGACGCGH